MKRILILNIVEYQYDGAWNSENPCYGGQRNATNSSFIW